MERVGLGIGGGSLRGSLVVADGQGWVVQPPGATAGFVLTLDPTESSGVKWAAIEGSEAIMPEADTAGSIAVYDGEAWDVIEPSETDGQVLVVDSGAALGVAWDDIPSQFPAVGAAGAMLVSDGSAWVSFAPGSAVNGQVLVRDSGEASGVKWGYQNWLADTPVTATDGTTVTFNLATSDWQIVTLGGNRTLAISNPTAGQQFTLQLTQDGTGSRTVTWFSGIKWQGGAAPTLSTTAGKIDVFTFKCTSVGNYLGFVVGQGMS